jgi:hypothetical protein
MASTDVVEIGGLITYQGNGFTALDGTIIETIDRDDIMPDHKQYMSIMDITEEATINPSQQYAAKAAPRSMQNRLETGAPASAIPLFTPKKGIATVEIGASYSMSKKFTEWAKKANNIEGAPGEMESELLKVAEFTRDLALAYDSRTAEEMVKVLANGFSGGTLTPKGKNLFDTHTYGVTGSGNSGTFVNFTNGAITFTSSAADILAGTTRLQALINQLKGVRDENGKFVKRATVYKLLVSRANEVFWRQVLNDNSQFSGQGSNANQENQFNFKGNLVKLEVLDLLGQPDYAGTTIGTANMIFVINSDLMRQTKALKLFRVYPLTIESWENKSTKVITVDGIGDIGVDHYGAELAVAGSTCA